MDTEKKSLNIKFFIAEFIFVFLGVFAAFWINAWGERKRDKEFAKSIIKNITEDIRSDSTQILVAIKMVSAQHSDLSSLIAFLGKGDYKSANELVGSCYRTFNAFEPTTESYQSMIYGGDLKLIDDYNVIKRIKEIDHLNQQHNHIHELYYKAIEDVRNSFICTHDLDNFDFRRVKNRIEFWNRINFLQQNYIENYLQTLTKAQGAYNDFLNESRLIE